MGIPNKSIQDNQEFREAIVSPVKNKSILSEAEDIIYGDREKTYGHPAVNLENIAEYWTTYLKQKNLNKQSLTTDDICNMMVLLKVARLMNEPTHHDSMVDICGYTALMERVQVYMKDSQAMLRAQREV